MNLILLAEILFSLTSIFFAALILKPFLVFNIFATLFGKQFACKSFANLNSFLAPIVILPIPDVCYNSAIYNLDNMKVGCFLLKKDLSDIYNYYQKLYGQCSNNNEWQKLYFSYIIARNIEDCYNKYYGLHVEDKAHTNVFPCSNLFIYSKNPIEITPTDVVIILNKLKKLEINYFDLDSKQTIKLYFNPKIEIKGDVVIKTDNESIIYKSHYINGKKPLYLVFDSKDFNTKERTFFIKSNSYVLINYYDNEQQISLVEKVAAAKKVESFFSKIDQILGWFVLLAIAFIIVLVILSVPIGVLSALVSSAPTILNIILNLSKKIGKIIAFIKIAIVIAAFLSPNIAKLLLGIDDSYKELFKSQTGLVSKINKPVIGVTTLIPKKDDTKWFLYSVLHKSIQNLFEKKDIILSKYNISVCKINNYSTIYQGRDIKIYCNNGCSFESKTGKPINAKLFIIDEAPTSEKEYGLYLSRGNIAILLDPSYPIGEKDVETIALELIKGFKAIYC
ncbi:NEQ380 [Nanoarchaeum equitans Kin4-M]|uniref:NEQ380 n=1 Tax=Nanoarchaeum equitans (strain Kin4-M) TaxID=228908 RepID=Q74N09_NANEQ|nr:NEQ380 [Nanoarchaeum equitans Kin4-M]